jgi:hypothetical protein
VALEGDVVRRAGFGLHVQLSIEHQRKARVRREHIKFALSVMPGVCIGCFINQVRRSVPA